MKINQSVLKKRNHFETVTWKHFIHYIGALENDEYMSAAVYASVFLESLLKDILSDFFNAKYKNEELQGLITALNRMLNNADKKAGTLDSKAVPILNDISRRANEVRSKRNRLVHDEGLITSTLESDVRDIQANIECIFDEYCEITGPKHEQEGASEEKLPEATFRIFISTITPHKLQQTEFINDFCHELKKEGIMPVMCGDDQYDSRDPEGIIRNLIETCSGTIVIGLERAHGYYMRYKEGSESEKSAYDQHYSSSWLQLEAGMTIGLGKKLFVMCENDIYNDGIFDSFWNSYTPYRFNPFDGMKDESVRKVLNLVKKYKEQSEKS